MQHGGKRERAGRPKGAVNKATADVKAAAQRYTSDAIETLAQIMRTSGSDAARVQAADKLLDRGYGKAAQSVAVDGNVTLTLSQLIVASGVE